MCVKVWFCHPNRSEVSFVPVFDCAAQLKESVQGFYVGLLHQMAWKEMTVRELLNLYSHHFSQKMNRFENRLQKAGIYSGRIHAEPSRIKGGFRSRAKFKIISRNNELAVLGTDPLAGKTAYPNILWMLPERLRSVTRSAAECLLESYPSAAVDGWELNSSHGREEAVLILSVKKNHSGRYSRLAVNLMQIPGVQGVMIPSRRDCFGKTRLAHRILGHDFISPAGSFFQTHMSLTRKLIGEIRRHVRKTKYRKLIDFYCGSGLLSLYSSSPSEDILGLDSDAASVECARENAVRCGWKDAVFETGRVDNFEEFTEPGPNDLVILDPPRQGVPADVIAALSERETGCVCLVFCSVESAEMDLKQWKENGYEILSLTALDMFPFTSFLESIAFLRKKK